jgi:hypothetical protein
MELMVPMAHITQDIRNTPIILHMKLLVISTLPYGITHIIYRSMIIFAHLYKAEQKQFTTHTWMSFFFRIISGVYVLTCSVKRHKGDVTISQCDQRKIRLEMQFEI